jgi:hypothetical protein
MTLTLPPPVLQHPFWHLGGIILFLVLWVVNRRTQSSGILLLALWNLAGVILHELAHLVIGILLRARPTNISLIPRRRGNSWQLGSVSFTRMTAFNTVPISLAPLLLAGLAWLVAYNWYQWLTSGSAGSLQLAKPAALWYARGRRHHHWHQGSRISSHVPDRLFPRLLPPLQAGARRQPG